MLILEVKKSKQTNYKNTPGLTGDNSETDMKNQSLLKLLNEMEKKNKQNVLEKIKKVFIDKFIK